MTGILVLVFLTNSFLFYCIIDGSVLLIDLILTTVMILFLFPLFLACLGWDRQCFSQHCHLQSLGLTLRGSRGSYIKRCLSLAICITDLAELLVGWLLAADECWAAVSCHSSLFGFHRFLLTYVPCKVLGTTLKYLHLTESFFFKKN